MLHKVIEYRKITPENLASMSDEEFLDGNRRLIDTLNEYRDDVVSSGWLTAEDVSEYESTFRKAEESIGRADFTDNRKQTEAIACVWDKEKFYPLRGDCPTVTTTSK